MSFHLIVWVKVRILTREANIVMKLEIVLAHREDLKKSKNRSSNAQHKSEADYSTQAEVVHHQTQECRGIIKHPEDWEGGNESSS